MMKWMGEDRDDELWRVGFFAYLDVMEDFLEQTKV